ncbi:3'(2'),5'-bisphosphate nucleotidase CysQ [Magnetococcales bacterium HHB-1]
MTISMDKELAAMQSAARQAGVAVMKYYRPGQQVTAEANVREKSADNPLTQADLESDTILREQLMQAFPDYGWLSEETLDNLDRLKKTRVWVVDPIDGTKEFIDGIPQFAISIGLVDGGVPVAACVYNPALDEMFIASKGGGAYLNGEAIHTSTRKQLLGASCITSRSEIKRGDWVNFDGEFILAPIGSIAYKMAVAAMGRFDMTFTLTPKNEWDFCAGTLLIQEAGGQVTNKAGEPFQFNQESPLVLSVVTSNGPLHNPLLERLKDVPLTPGRQR